MANFEYEISKAKAILLYDSEKMSYGFIQTSNEITNFFYPFIVAVICKSTDRIGKTDLLYLGKIENQNDHQIIKSQCLRQKRGKQYFVYQSDLIRINEIFDKIYQNNEKHILCK